MTEQNTAAQGQHQDLEYFQELFDLGKSLITNKDYDKGIAKLQKGLGILQEKSLMDNPLAADIMDAIGNGYRAKAGASPDPIVYLNNAIKEMRATLPATHPGANAQMIKALSGIQQHTHAKLVGTIYDIIDTLAKSADINDTLIIQEARYTLTLNLLNQAVKEFKEGLPGVENQFSHELSDSVANVCEYLHSQIAPYHYKEGGSANAGLTLYDGLYKSMQAAFPEGHNMIGIYAANVGLGFNILGNHAEAAKFYEHSLDLLKASTLANKDAVLESISSLIAGNSKLLANTSEVTELLITENAEQDFNLTTSFEAVNQTDILQEVTLDASIPMVKDENVSSVYQEAAAEDVILRDVTVDGNIAAEPE